MEQRIVFSENLQEELAKAIAECEHDKIFVLTDDTTARLCWPVVSAYWSLRGARLITIAAGDDHKSLDAVAHVWQQLQQGGASRHSLLINLGGGMVTDLGGFAASTFKRGINFINIPTTLLSMVDASVGGKTGFNFGGLKNEIGVFQDSRFVILDTVFLQTLDHENLLSGYAEMLKHSLIADEKMWACHVNFCPSLTENGEIPTENGELRTERYDWVLAQKQCTKSNHTSQFSVLSSQLEPLSSQLKQMLRQSVMVKERIVTEDPHERGLRKALNLGHTVGHAFESFAMKKGKPVLHGYAVAYGLVCELYLSAVKCGFPTQQLRQTVAFIRENYGQMAITCKDYPALLELMTHDKKNSDGRINFTLLGGIGDIRINQNVSDEDIREALDFYREG
ncbi:MAG: 3-dehydroquinate synthase [Prevotella sp.]|nr:3-dehydroquinate synthase [Prevotella sp.]